MLGAGDLPVVSPPTACLFAPLARQRCSVVAGKSSVSLPTHDSPTFASRAALEYLRKNNT